MNILQLAERKNCWRLAPSSLSFAVIVYKDASLMSTSFSRNSVVFGCQTLEQFQLIKRQLDRVMAAAAFLGVLLLYR